MELLLRRRLTGDRGETVDHALSGARLSLGNAENSDFLLPGLPGGVLLREAGQGGLALSSSDGDFEFRGRQARRITLRPGEEAEIHGLTLRVFEPPTGFDAGLEVEGESLPAGADLRPRELAPWSMRRASWLLAGLALLLLVVPLLFTYGGLDETLTALPGMPGDRLWSSGPLSAVHRAAGLDESCADCHSRAFRRVADSACSGCHADLHEHIDTGAFEGLAMQETRCASCHREHNEPQWLIVRDNGLCTDCHAAPGDWRSPGKETPRAVQMFTDTGHPEFRLSSWRPLGDGAARGWELTRLRRPAGGIEDRSGLKFNHAVHLNAEKVRHAAKDEALGCASCHRLLDDGEHFAAISMDEQCRDCHQLNFDPFDPDIELPHGNTRAAFEAMEAHFIREFTDPLLRAERSQQKPRRLPGKRMAAAVCEGNGLECGRQEAQREASYQFADSGCVTCHEVRDTQASAAIDRWFVHPVKLTGDWYSESRFDHRSHLSLDGRSGEDLCLDCHPADRSENARDALIPGRDNCLGCHAADAQLATAECSACHRLHRPGGSPVTASREVPPR